MTFRAPKPWTLTDTETITSFHNWKSNLLYHLSTTTEFVPFLELEWQPKGTPNRGLVADGEAVVAANRKTAAQKSIILERMLGMIAQFVPPLLSNDVIKKSTGLAWIWTRVRKHFSFTQSEVNFLKLHTIKKKDDERYETLFQRIIAHLEDNLLTVASNIHHDGAAVAADEIMSPTTERLATFMWLQLIDVRLPAYVARVYAHDLQTKSLKDIQPQLAENMDSLLSELEAQEDIQINYSRSSYHQQRGRYPPATRPRYPQRSQQHQHYQQHHHQQIGFAHPRGSNPSPRLCILCKSAGRPHTGHDIGTCWFISKDDKLSISDALCGIADNEGEPTPLGYSTEAVQESDPIMTYRT